MLLRIELTEEKVGRDEGGLLAKELELTHAAKGGGGFDLCGGHGNKRGDRQAINPLGVGDGGTQGGHGGAVRIRSDQGNL